VKNEELNGVPAKAMSKFKERTKALTDVEKFVLFRGPSYASIMRNATNSAIRKQFYHLNANAFLKNAPVFKELLVSRYEIARLLKYPSHAAFVLEEQTAGGTTTQWVLNFFQTLESGLRERGEEEIDVLKSLKREELRRCNTRVPTETFFISWDKPYYKRLMEEKVFQVQRDDVEEYFPVDSTVPAMLRVFGSFFGVRFEQVSAHDLSGLIWHADIEVYSVWNTTRECGEFAGYLYFDLFSRDLKYAGGQAKKFQPVCLIKGIV
jgi:metallopeptidase MepB